MGKTREKPQGGRPREKALCRRGEMIEDRLAAKEWTVDELATSSGVDRQTIYHIMSGKTSDPKASTLRKLAACLEMPLAVLASE